jgi:hypothetical protein
MAARQSKDGKYHNTLSEPILGMEQAEDLKAKLFGARKPPSAEAKRAIAKIHRCGERLGDIEDGDRD